MSPGSQYVRFFERLGQPLGDPQPTDVEELTRVARECGMDFRL